MLSRLSVHMPHACSVYKSIVHAASSRAVETLQL